MKSIDKRKNQRTIGYLGCDLTTFKLHLTAQLKPGMTWANYGTEWHIDHVVPIMYCANPDEPPTLERVKQRLHYTNTQPMWASDNMAKGNRFIG